MSVQNRRWYCNLKFLFLFTFEGNIQCTKKVLRLASAIECADGDKLDRGYFASGIFSGKILKPQRFNIGQGIFSLDVNRILRFQVTLEPLSKNVITQLVLVTNKNDRSRNFWSVDPSIYWNSRACSVRCSLRRSILVPRGRAPFGQHQESRPLAVSNNGSPRFTDFPSLCACSESSLTNLIGSGLNLLCLQIHSKPGCRWSWPEVAILGADQKERVLWGREWRRRR